MCGFIGLLIGQTPAQAPHAHSARRIPCSQKLALLGVERQGEDCWVQAQQTVGVSGPHDSKCQTHAAGPSTQQRTTSLADQQPVKRVRWMNGRANQSIHVSARVEVVLDAVDVRPARCECASPSPRNSSTGADALCCSQRRTCRCGGHASVVDMRVWDSAGGQLA